MISKFTYVTISNYTIIYFHPHDFYNTLVKPSCTMTIVESTKGLMQLSFKIHLKFGILIGTYVAGALKVILVDLKNEHHLFCENMCPFVYFDVYPLCVRCVYSVHSTYNGKNHVKDMHNNLYFIYE